jgi:hypothetical protein
VVLFLAACGSSSGNTTTQQKQLTRAQYRAHIAKIRVEAAKAQTDVGKGLQAKSVDELKQRVDEFAAATQRIGDEIAGLNPPTDARPANTELAKGLQDIAAGTRAAGAKIAGMKTVQEAISYLQHSQGPIKGSREVTEALTELQKLGFATANG